MKQDRETIAKSQRLFALRKTWAYARERSPFYREWLPDLAAPNIDFDTLQTLPVLSKADLEQNYLNVFGGQPLPAGMLFTGGSTGRPQIVFVSDDEMELQSALDSIRFEGARTDRPLALITSGGSQGRLPIAPSEHNYICVPLRSKSGYEWAWRMLIDEHRFAGSPSRITQLLLPLPAIKKLVNLMAERRLGEAELALQTVVSYSAYLSRGWRRRIECALGARLIDCYGFTEAPQARAFECPVCAHYHFKGSVLAEYLSLDSANRIEAGTGRLCVTTLYPQTQAFILFRYDPGDIIEIGPRCPEIGIAGFRPKGRVQQTVAVERQGRTIYPILATDVQETVDTHHWVARSTNLRHSGVTLTEADSWPKWRLSKRTVAERTELVLEIELTSSPFLFSDTWLSTREGFRSTLTAENPTLAAMTAAGEIGLIIEGLPPGSIAESEIVRC